MANLFSKTLTLDDLTKVDFNSYWYPHDMLAALQNAAQSHSRELGCGFRVLRTKNMAWVLCRITLEIQQLPKLGDTITIKTWPGAPQKYLYPRYYSVEDENGKVLVKASSIWLLLDLASRKATYPGSLIIYQHDESFLPANMPLPERLRLANNFSNKISRIPQYSEIDANKHLNNAQYLRWICDLFDWRRYRLNRIASVQINYVKEIPPSAPVQIAWETTDNVSNILATSSDGNTYFESQVFWQ